MTYLLWLVLFFNCCSLSLQLELNFVIYYQSADEDLPFVAEDVFKDLDTHGDISRTYQPFNYSEPLGPFRERLCSHLGLDKFNIILDLAWTNNNRLRQLSIALDVPYYKADLTIYPFLEPAVKYIQARQGGESLFILPDELRREQAMYGLVQNSDLPIVVVNGFDGPTARMIAARRPIPLFNTIVANSNDMNNLFEQAMLNGLVKIQDRWNLVFLDPFLNRFKYLDKYPEVSKLVLDQNFYCQWFPQAQGRECSWPKGPFDHVPIFLATLLADLIRFYKSSTYGPQLIALCEDNFNAYPLESNLTSKLTESEYFAHLLHHPVLFATPNNQIKFKLDSMIYKWNDLEENTWIGNYSSNSGNLMTSVVLEKPRRYFRIGTAFALPWSMYKLDPITGQPLRTPTGEPVWEGYCIDFIQRLSEVMDFDYDIVEPESKTMGERVDGKFNGVIGDLVSGETDLAVAAIIMRADREEVIDFVPPAFEESGISIVIRNPLRTTSLFKFMSVLKREVWITIVLALITSAVLLWLIDKYSPFSGQNREYVYESRIFTLKESIWFTLTSYTPQGGGELPKSLSARTLVATYWLFVVLILATFTANLAAFLTVERMQTPVQSLEQLAKQSRIAYSCVEGSPTHEYFINMKFAEEMLYETWKNTSMEAHGLDQNKYRVWDYPIPEQFGAILRAIQATKTVKDAAEGFRNVMEHNADYAFIHDHQAIRYELVRNCDLTEVGEKFGMIKYAIAVQQGNSKLTDELTEVTMQLMSERFFVHLNEKYWNASIGNCLSDENDGMTLESLGGVFIVTLFGLGLALVALVIEWYYYWRKMKEVVRNTVEPIGVPVIEGSSAVSIFPKGIRRRNIIPGDDVQPEEGFGKSKRTVSIIDDLE